MSGVGDWSRGIIFPSEFMEKYECAKKIQSKNPNFNVPKNVLQGVCLYFKEFIAQTSSGDY